MGSDELMGLLAWDWLGGNKMREEYNWVVIFMGLLSTAGSYGLGRISYGLLLPEMKEGLALSYTQAGLLGTGYFFGYFIASGFAGTMAAKYGSRLVIGSSLLFMGATSVATGMSNSFGFALFARFLTGIGNAGAYIPAMALGSLLFSARKRGLATGIVSAGIGIGTSLVGLLVPLILAQPGLGWRWAWQVMGSINLGLGILCFIFLLDGHRILALGSNTLGDGLDRKRAQASPRPEAWREGIAFFRAMMPLGLTYFTFGFANVMFTTFFIVYVVKEAGLNNQTAGLMLSLIGTLGISCGIIWGAVSDRAGRRAATSLAYTILAISYAMLGLFKSELAIEGVAVILGFTIWSIPTLMAVICGDYLGPSRASSGLGVITVFFSLGLVLGPMVGGYLVDVGGSLKWAFFLASLVALAGSASTLLVLKPRIISADNPL